MAFSDCQFFAYVIIRPSSFLVVGIPLYVEQDGKGDLVYETFREERSS